MSIFCKLFRMRYANEFQNNQVGLAVKLQQDSILKACKKVKINKLSFLWGKELCAILFISLENRS